MKKLINIRGRFTVPWDKGALIYHKSGMCGFCGNKKYGYKAVRKDVIIAIYHCHIQIISRGKSKSAVAAAAYRSGEKLTNEYDGITHDYTKKGGVIHTEILLPEYAPKKYADRSTLWNAVEEVEKAKNSQLAREIEIALPNELSLEECRELAQNFCQKTFVDKGMVVFRTRAQLYTAEVGDCVLPKAHCVKLITFADNSATLSRGSYTSPATALLSTLLSKKYFRATVYTKVSGLFLCQKERSSH